MSKVQKFRSKIDNFFGWVKVTELVELDEIDVSEDPVRPELDVEWRTSYGRKIYGLKYQDEIEGIICIAYTNDVPSSVKELDLMSQNAHFKKMLTQQLLIQYGVANVALVKRSQAKLAT